MNSKALQFLRRLIGRRSAGVARLLALLLTVLLLGLRLADPTPVETLRLKTFDLYANLFPREGPEQPVVVVDLDEESLAEHGQWPWPRTLVADMLIKLRQAGAVIVGFDIVFAEADRLSPSRFAETLPQLDPETRALLADMKSNDLVMAEALKVMPSILGQSGYFREIEARRDERPITPAPFAAVGGDPLPYLIRFPEIVRNIPVLEAAAAGTGMFTLLPEQDGIVRRVPALMRLNDIMLPTLTLEMLRVATGGAPLVIRSDEAGVAAIRLAGVNVPTDRHGRIWVHFSRHQPELYISAADVIAGRVPQRDLAGRLVLIGTSATGLFDIKSTPLDAAMPGVEVRAQLIQTILSGDFLHRPNYALGAELAVAAFISLIMMIVVPMMGARPAFYLGAGIAAVVIGGSLYFYVNQGLLLSASYPLIASLLIYFLLVFHNYFSEESQRRYVRAAFGQYISKELVEQLAEGHEKLALGGEIKEMTMLFSDVRGFTGVSEIYKADPQGLTRLMNRFLTPITHEIVARRGTIDKYMGDAVMAFWNAPLDDAEHHKHACDAALAILRAIDALNEERRKEAAVFNQPFMPLQMGIGVNSGHSLVGNLGSDMHFNYSVLGDPVNIASRLEGLTKLYGVPVVVGESTYLGARGEGNAEAFAFIELDLIRVKGKTQPERVYGLFGDGTVAVSPEFLDIKQQVDAMLAAFRTRRWQETRQKLEGCRSRIDGFPLETFIELYEERVAGLQADPPPEDWDGVMEAASK